MKNKSSLVMRTPNISFTHIPKTGGQSVHAAFKTHNRPHLPVRDPARQLDLARADFAFAYVRNPLDRAASLYHWLAELSENTKIRRVPANAALGQWAQATDINEFWLKIDVDYLARYSPMVRPQSYFIAVAGEVDPRLTILRFEDFGAEWAQVEEAAGRKLALPKVNSSRHQSWEEELSDEAQERITQLYAADFELLGY